MLRKCDLPSENTGKLLKYFKQRNNLTRLFWELILALVSVMVGRVRAGHRTGSGGLAGT